jgi:hypothetical protein
LQALEKIANSTNWISIVLLLLLVLIAVLKVLDSEKLKGYVFAVFNKGFADGELGRDTSFFSLFHSVLFVFSSLVLAFVISLITAQNKDGLAVSFSYYLTISGVVFSYLLIKRLLEVAFSNLFLLRKRLRFYIVSKYSSLYSICFFLLILFTVCQFGPLSVSNLAPIIIGLFLVRFVLHIRHNKNLVFNELFYFILYLCAFEIAPLLTLFKLMF